MIHFIDQPAHVLRGEIVELGVAGVLEEIAREIRAPVVVRLVGADHVPAGTPNRLAQLRIEGLCAFRGSDAHHLAGLYARPAAKREVDQNRGVSFENLFGWDVGHALTLPFK